RKAGARFRHEVLARGGSRPALESFIAFRGRAPQIDALLRHNGMSPSSDSQRLSRRCRTPETGGAMTIAIASKRSAGALVLLILLASGVVAAQTQPLSR